MSKLASFALASALICSCAVEYDNSPPERFPRNRLVVDAETGEPIPGAIALFRWQRFVTGIGGTVKTCVHAAMAESGADGRYVVPEWRGLGPSTAGVYKPGYSDVGNWPARYKGLDELRRFTGTPMQRYGELSGVDGQVSDCDDFDQMTKKLYVVIAEEARTLARASPPLSKEEALKLSRLQFNEDQVLYGTDEAYRRIRDRDELIHCGGRRSEPAIFKSERSDGWRKFCYYEGRCRTTETTVSLTQACPPTFN